MTKSERLDYIRKRAMSPLPMTTEAASTLETLKQEDPDLGGPASHGETIPAPRRIHVDRVSVEDESEIETDVISPAMRAATC